MRKAHERLILARETLLSLQEDRLAKAGGGSVLSLHGNNSCHECSAACTVTN